MNLRNGAGAQHLTLPALMASIPFSFPHEASIAPFLNEIAADLDLSTGVAGQLGTTTCLGGIAAALALAPMIGQMAIRRVLVLSLLAVSATSLASSIVAPGYDGYKVLLSAVAVGMALAAVALLASTRRDGDAAVVEVSVTDS